MQDAQRPRSPDAPPPLKVVAPPPPAHDDPAIKPRSAPKRLGIRSVVALVVLLPLLTITAVTGVGVAGSWGSHVRAQAVEKDVRALKAITQARLDYDNAAAPIVVYGSAASIGLSPIQTEAILHTRAFNQVATQQQAEDTLNGDAVLRSTPALRDDKAASQQLLSQLISGTYGAGAAVQTVAKTGIDLNALWAQNYAALQADIKSMDSSGGFPLDAAALRDVWVAWDSGVYQAYEAPMIPVGLGYTRITDVSVGLDLAQKTALFNLSSSQFSNELQSGAQKAWRDLQSDPQVAKFRTTLAEALGLTDTGMPRSGDVLVAAAQIRSSLVYINRLTDLVEAASGDLATAADQLTTDATMSLIRLTVLLVLVIGISAAGVMITGAVLTRPIQALASAAHRVYEGDFDVQALPPAGPREVTTATAAFNDMALTLKAVEAKAMALGDEDFSRAELYTPLPGRTGRALQSVVDQLTNSIQARVEQHQEMYEAATHDKLTGLPNKLYFRDRAEHALRVAWRNQTNIALAFIDLDDFRRVNDRYGHTVGDDALRAIGGRLLRYLRAADTVARIGGDKFATLLESDMNEDRAADVAERLVKCVAEPCELDGQEVIVHASVGIVVMDAVSTVDSMLQNASEAMYSVKSNGKQWFSVYKRQAL